MVQGGKYIDGTVALWSGDGRSSTMAYLDDYN